MNVVSRRIGTRGGELVRLTVHRAEGAALIDGLEYRPYKIVKKNDPGKDATKSSAPVAYVH